MVWLVPKWYYDKVKKEHEAIMSGDGSYNKFESNITPVVNVWRESASYRSGSGDSYKTFEPDSELELPVGYHTNQTINALKRKKKIIRERLLGLQPIGNGLGVDKDGLVHVVAADGSGVVRIIEKTNDISNDSSVYDIVATLGNAQSVEELDRLYKIVSTPKQVIVKSDSNKLAFINGMYWVVLSSFLAGVVFMPIGFAILKRASIMYLLALVCMVLPLIFLHVLRTKPTHTIWNK